LCWLLLLLLVTVTIIIISYCYYYCHCLLFFLNFDVNVNVNDNGSCGCHVNANVNVNWILGSSSSTPSAKLLRCQPSDAVFGRCHCSFNFMAICVSWYSFEDPHQQLFSPSHMWSTFLSTSLSSSTRRMQLYKSDHRSSPNISAEGASPCVVVVPGMLTPMRTADRANI
jgi:hypothetical protein